MNALTDRKREVWIDWMRFFACFMVMMVHSVEPFYLGGKGSQILSASDAWWVSLFDTLARACVPVFVVASAYLQFPIRYSTKEFFKRRAVRILIPFIFWTVVYALVWGSPATNFKDLPLNFNYAAGHLWFVYMLLGLYLIMPLLSPWAEKVSKKELQIYLTVWLFTTLIPLIRAAAAGPDITVIAGPSGIPMPATYPIWGEASWNGYGIFYYLCGFVGYMLIGLYFRKFVGELSTKRTLAISIPCWTAGFCISFFDFLRRVWKTSDCIFPINEGVAAAVGWETNWAYDTIGIALMTIAWIVLFRKIKCDGLFYEKVILPVSKAGYGMYLCHMLILARVSGLFRTAFGIGGDNLWATPVEIILTAAVSFILTAAVSVLIRKIPRLGRYIVG